MYRFPKDLYADIRLEDVFQTSIVYENGALTRTKTSREAGAFLRVWDGHRWSSATTNLGHIRRSWMPGVSGHPNPAIGQDPVVLVLRSTGTNVFSGIKIDMCGKYPTRKRLPCSSPIYLW